MLSITQTIQAILNHIANLIYFYDLQDWTFSQPILDAYLEACWQLVIDP